MAKISFPKGAGKRVGIKLLQSGLMNLYHEIAHDDKSFKKDILSRIKEKDIQDSALGVEGNLYEVAKEYGLENQLDNYINRELTGWKGATKWTLDFITSAKDGLEDVIEAVEVVGTAAATPETAGAGGVVVELGGNAIEIPTYLVTQTLYSALAGILGFASDTYSFSKKGLKNYFVDIAKGYTGVLGNVVPIAGTILELSTNLDDKRPRIAQSISDRAEFFLLNEIRKQKGLPLLEKTERDLEDMIKGAKSIFKKKPSLKGEPLIDYEERISTPFYGSDLGFSTAYATMPYSP